MFTFMVFEENFAGDKVEDHTKGGCHNFGNNLMPVQLIVECGIKPDIEAKERNTIKNRKFNKEAPTRFAIGSVEDPGCTGPEVENRRNREGNGVGPEWRKIWN